MAPDVRPSGVITLLTDFGSSDPFVGVMKGVILSRFGAAQIVDLTHGIPPQDRVCASFWLARSYAWFPPGSVHVVVVDPGVGSDRGTLVLRAHGHLFVGPDNGVMAGVFERAAGVDAREIDVPALGLPPPSSTFHGRDIFAPVAADLASGRRRFEDVGWEKASLEELEPARVRHTDAGLEGTVVTVDHYGNLVTNLEAPLVPADGAVRVMVGGEGCPLRRTYADVQSGGLVALIGSFGTVEVACRDGNAAEVLGVGSGAPVMLQSVPKPAAG